MIEQLPPLAAKPSDSTPFTLLVNSSDGFRDCWPSFFLLLNRYWPGLREPIILNTETLHWTSDVFDIQCSTAETEIGRRLSWSECLYRALLQVKTELVLYMQEDYFIERPVDDLRIRALTDLMHANRNITHVGLTHFGSQPPFSASECDTGLWTISPKARYRVSTQAALWRTQALSSMLLPWENGWMFEIFGSIRARRRDDLLLTVRRDEGEPPIYYQHTGIVKGRWSRFVPELFEREGIQMDFSKRGFHDGTTPAIVRRAGLLAKVASHPLLAIKSLTSR